MAEKTKEQLQAEAEKAAKDLQAVTEKLQSAQKEFEAKPEDEKLKKKVEGLSKAVESAKQKLDASQTALKEAENAGGSTGEVNTGNKKTVRLKVRNKTGRPTYYRAGLCFSSTDADYEVTEDIAKILQSDPWLAAEKIK
ncbi:hypothetical protein KP615_09805 [Treponema denticola]|jgi:hypothetical protein|uniref:hypothetical protein n=1 Tax=Treponema denticola TaxID=158 RepID=UPI002065B27E|nr:MAG TPA: hypothetical protein [Caudoviricetes sp.]DAW76969.1 MAG TPA: hypothetical protein [Caudoviricetes sp.]